MSKIIVMMVGLSIVIASLIILIVYDNPDEAWISSIEECNKNGGKVMEGLNWNGAFEYCIFDKNEHPLEQYWLQCEEGGGVKKITKISLCEENKGDGWFADECNEKIVEFPYCDVYLTGFKNSNSP